MNQRVMEGQIVFDAEGNELGKVKEVRGRYFKVDAPMAPDYWLRIDDLTSGSATGDLVVVAGAEQYSNPDMDYDTGTRATLDREYTTAGTSRAAVGTTTGHEHVDHDDKSTLQMREERLRVDKEREQAGEVHLGKRVTETTEQVNVPLREERVVIERHPGSGRTTDGDITDSDEEIDISLMKERAVVDKETVVREDVTARKEVTERTEPVQASLRREELVVEGDEEIVEEGRNLNMPRTAEYEQERLRRNK